MPAIIFFEFICTDPSDAHLDAKCKFLFTQFDKDQDGYLNCAEMNIFTQTVNVSHDKIDDDAWLKLCKYWVRGIGSVCVGE